VKTFYISLVKDLLGCYLLVESDSQERVRRYLEHEYFDEKHSIWKLPWCAIYDTLPTEAIQPGRLPNVIRKREPIL
jgi:hypothetical protein